jgi:NAD(P)-dependent dehydrogenase (short-subunit alcohol dehydrogenase family)
MRRLEGKRVLITGGARGIGLALAVRLAAEGSEIVLADLPGSPLPEAAQAVGGTVAHYALDVTDQASIDDLQNRVKREAGPVDILVNSAGVVFGGPFLEVPLDEHLKTYRVNVLGLVALTRTFLPDLIARPRAHLVNIASASGFIGLPLGSTYASSKWAVIGFTDSIRLELKMQGYRHVRATAVCPSYVGTGMFDGARAPRLTRILTPEKVARLTVRAIKRNRPYVLTPWLVKLTPPLKALLPDAIFNLVASGFGATSGMASWRGRG